MTDGVAYELQSAMRIMIDRLVGWLVFNGTFSTKKGYIVPCEK